MVFSRFLLQAGLCAGVSMSATAVDAPAQPVAPMIGFGETAMIEHWVSDPNQPAKLAGFRDDSLSADVIIQVDEAGRVVAATADHRFSGPRPQDRVAVRAALTMKFRPFAWDAQPARALSSVTVSLPRPKLWAIHPEPFPLINGTDFEITLQRSACYGNCPDYSLTIYGTGVVVFSTNIDPIDPVSGLFRAHAYGQNGSLVHGTHRTTVPIERISALVEQFKHTRFFSLRNEYRASITDNPSYRITFRSGKSEKTVVDYVGEAAGMPTAVTDLEDAIDEVGGSKRWVSGDATTAPALAAEGFDFRSRAAQALLLAAAIPPFGADYSEALVLDLVGRGVELEDHLPGTGKNGPVLIGAALFAVAAQNGRRHVYDRLVAEGWLKRTPKPLLTEALAQGAGCDVGIARDLIAFGVSPESRDNEGKTALANVVNDPGVCGNLRTRLSFARDIIALGVPIDAPDNDGKTALWFSEDLEMTELLLSLGARADHRAKDGSSLAFSTWDDRTSLTLLRAGADPGAAGEGDDPLRKTATERLMPGTLAWLNAHGVP